MDHYSDGSNALLVKVTLSVFSLQTTILITTMPDRTRGAGGEREKGTSSRCTNMLCVKRTRCENEKCLCICRNFLLKQHPVIAVYMSWHHHQSLFHQHSMQIMFVWITSVWGTVLQMCEDELARHRCYTLISHWTLMPAGFWYVCVHSGTLECELSLSICFP